MSNIVQRLEERIRELESALAEARQEVGQCLAAQRRTEAALADTITKYRTTFDLAAVGIAHLTPEGRWLRVNPFLCDMLGYTREELQTKTFQELTHPDDLQADLQLVDDLLEGKISSYAMEKRYLRKDGHVIWGHLSVSLMRDDEGEPKYFISIVKNIDPRIRAIAETERSRARLKAVLDSLSEGVLVYNHEGEVLEVNSTAIALGGYVSAGDLTGRFEDFERAFDVATLDGRPVSAEDWPIIRLLRGQPVSRMELVVRRKGSDKTWIGSFSGSLVRIDRDSPPIAIMTVEDVTQRTLAETALRVSEERFRLALDNIPDMIAIYDTDLKIQYVNTATVQQSGWYASDAAQRLAAGLHPNPLTMLWHPIAHDALATATTQTDDISYPSVAGMRSLAVTCVPLTESGGKVREVMLICHDYTDRRQAEERARQAALHDPLTGLPNRALLFEYARHIFASAERMHLQVAIAFIDLDRFKPINDVHGHEVGDAVLRQAAHRLQENVRGEDMIFRLGGDEFLALLPRVENSDAPSEFARHVMEAIGRPYHVGALELSLSCSIGISLYPHDGTEVDALISDADAAMYEAKQRGRNNFQFYTKALAERVQTQSVIEHQIRAALTHREFCLHYQPVVDMHTDEVVSVEALLRWPGNGLAPDRFVQVAESTGLIGRLGDWVLSEACHQHALWKEKGLPPIPVAVNVSALQFRQRDFSNALDAVLKRHRVDPSAIQLELTETAVMEDIDHAIATLDHFRKKGIKISLDDFGTGYSSLNYLSRLPLDKIKVDKSFVHRLEIDTASRAITESIIALGRTLNLEIVAEGIESASDMHYLRTHGCNQAQGFYVCQPVLGDAFASWYRSREPAPVQQRH